MAGSLPPVAGAVFDERRKVLGFSGAVGSRAVTVAFARSEDPGLVLLTVPFIGRERGENSGALWRPHSGHKFEPGRADPFSSVLSPNGGEDALQLRGDVGPHKGIGGGPTRCAHDLAPVPDLGQSAQRAIQGTLPLSGHPID